MGGGGCREGGKQLHVQLHLIFSLILYRDSSPFSISLAVAFKILSSKIYAFHLLRRDAVLKGGEEEEEVGKGKTIKIKAN